MSKYKKYTKNKKSQTKNTVRANKNLGQHFLVDTGIITRIVDAINPEENQNLLEIGPGLGAITLPVLERCKNLNAIELDRRVIPILQETSKQFGSLNIIEQDVLTVDYDSLLTSGDWHVFGNLPYNISTPILFTLTAQSAIKEMVFMLQKEVIDRMTALPGEKNYGRLSVMLSYHHDVYHLFDVPPESFSPPPKVMSAMVGISRLDTPRWQVNDENIFASVVKQAFSMKRKTLRNTLKPIISSEELDKLGIDSSLRAEMIDGEDFAKIANWISNKNNDKQ